MNLLVTGGAGFIGSNLVHHLLGESPDALPLPVSRVVTLDKLTYAGNRANLASLASDPRHVFIHGDIGDEPLVTALLHDYGIDAVMHLAAESHVDRAIDDPFAFITTNVLGTCRLLESYRKYLTATGRTRRPHYGQPLHRGGDSLFLHVSTDEVFGALADGEPAFHERSPYAPNNPYSASKAGSDHLVRAYHRTYGLPVVTTACSNNYGPWQFPEKLIPLMILKLLRGEALPVYGDGSQIRDWIHVSDHCRGLTLALARGRIGETYLIGGKNEVRNLDLVRQLISTVHELAPAAALSPAAARITHVADRPGHDPRYALDPSKIQRELGWAARVDFASGLRQTVRWYLENQDWLRAIEDGTYRG